MTRHIAHFGPLRQLDVNLPFDAVVVVDGVVVVVVVVVVDVVVVVVLLVVVGRVRSLPDLVGTTHDHQQQLFESNFNPKRHMYSKAMLKNLPLQLTAYRQHELSKIEVLRYLDTVRHVPAISRRNSQ